MNVVGTLARPQVDREHAPAGTQEPLRDLALRMAREAGVEDAAHLGVRLEVTRDRERGLRVTVEPDVERLDPAQDEERRPRRRDASRVDRDRPDRLDVPERPGDDPRDDVAVAAQPLRRRLDDEVRSERDRPTQVRRRERVVDDRGRAVGVRELGQPLDVGHDDARVRDRLHVEDARRPLGERRLDGGRVGRIDVRPPRPRGVRTRG